jgi:hypothetical protein
VCRVTISLSGPREFQHKSLLGIFTHSAVAMATSQKIKVLRIFLSFLYKAITIFKLSPLHIHELRHIYDLMLVKKSQ